MPDTHPNEVQLQKAIANFKRALETEDKYKVQQRNLSLIHGLMTELESVFQIEPLAEKLKTYVDNAILRPGEQLEEQQQKREELAALLVSKAENFDTLGFSFNSFSQAFYQFLLSFTPDSDENNQAEKTELLLDALEPILKHRSAGRIPVYFQRYLLLKKSKTLLWTMELTEEAETEKMQTPTEAEYDLCLLLQKTLRGDQQQIDTERWNLYKQLGDALVSRKRIAFQMALQNAPRHREKVVAQIALNEMKKVNTQNTQQFPYQASQEPTPPHSRTNIQALVYKILGITRLIGEDRANKWCQSVDRPQNTWSGFVSQVANKTLALLSLLAVLAYIALLTVGPVYIAIGGVALVPFLPPLPLTLSLALGTGLLNGLLQAKRTKRFSDFLGGFFVGLGISIGLLMTSSLLPLAIKGLGAASAFSPPLTKALLHLSAWIMQPILVGGACVGAWLAEAIKPGFMGSALMKTLGKLWSVIGGTASLAHRFVIAPCALLIAGAVSVPFGLLSAPVFAVKACGKKKPLPSETSPAAPIEQEATPQRSAQSPEARVERSARTKQEARLSNSKLSLLSCCKPRKKVDEQAHAAKRARP